MWFKIVTRTLTVVLLVNCVALAYMGWELVRANDNPIVGALGMMGAAVMASLLIVLWAASEGI